MRGRALIAVLAASAIALGGCRSGHVSQPRHPLHRHERTESLPQVPVPPSTARALPAGTWYLYAGPNGSPPPWSSIWEVANGQQSLLTRGAAGRQIDLFGASAAGIVVSDNANITAGLARWTANGPQWLHPRNSANTDIGGQLPAISPTGEIAYLLPPMGNNGSGDATIWVRSTWGGADLLVYRSPEYPLASAFGPDGMLAIIPVGQYLKKNQRQITIINNFGIVQTLNEPFASLLEPLWGTDVPGIIVDSSSGRSALLYLSGRQVMLPSGWTPLSWDPTGKEVLMADNRDLGLWSIKKPRQVVTIGSISKGYYIFQAQWLQRPAKL